MCQNASVHLFDLRYGSPTDCCMASLAGPARTAIVVSYNHPTINAIGDKACVLLQTSRPHVTADDVSIVPPRCSFLSPGRVFLVVRPLIHPRNCLPLFFLLAMFSRAEAISPPVHTSTFRYRGFDHAQPPALRRLSPDTPFVRLTPPSFRRRSMTRHRQSLVSV